MGWDAVILDSEILQRARLMNRGCIPIPTVHLAAGVLQRPLAAAVPPCPVLQKAGPLRSRWVVCTGSGNPDLPEHFLLSRFPARILCRELPPGASQPGGTGPGGDAAGEVWPLG